GGGIEGAEAAAGAVGGGGECSRAVAAIDFTRIRAAAALVEVCVIAGVPDEAVVTVAAEYGIAPRSANERLAAAAADQGVVATSALDGRRLDGSEDAVRLIDQDGVVSAAGVDPYTVG